MNTKEELKKEFESFTEAESIGCERYIGPDDWTNCEDRVFEWFWKHLEQRDEKIKTLAIIIDEYGKVIDNNKAEIKSLNDEIEQLSKFDER